MEKAIALYIILSGSLRYAISESETAITTKAGSTVTLPCSQAEHEFPGWRGPGIYGPDNTYSYAQSPVFGRPSLGDKVDRLRWDPTDNKSLIILNLNRNDSGTYICELRLQEQIYFHLTVKVLPKPVFVGVEVLNTTRTIIQGQEGRSLNLSCVTYGAHEKHLISMYETNDLATPLPANKTVTNNSDGTVTTMQSLLILATREFEGRRYVCKSTFNPPTAATTLSDEVELYLKLKPITPKLTSKPGVENLTNAVVECVTSGVRPIDSLKVWWNVGGSNTTGEVKQTLDTSTDTYNVTTIYQQQVDREDNGKKVECLMFHETLGIPMNVSTILNVHYPAKCATLTGNTTEMIANGVNKLELTCTASDSNPIPNFTWVIGNEYLKSDQEITSIEANDGIRMTSQLFHIIANRQYDHTEVYCVLTNDYDDATVESNRKLVDLLYHPVVNIDGPREIVEGNTGVWTLRCTADSNPAPIFTWYHGSTVLTENVEIMNKKSEYRIRSSERRNAGDYTCVANNGIDPEGRDTIYFVVKHKAEITTFSITKQGEQTNLLCSVVSTPPAQMTIVKDNRVVHVGNGVTSLEYNISHLNCLDSGTYTCTAFNEYNAGTFVTQSVNVTAACDAHTLEEIPAIFDETVVLSSTLMVYPVPTVNQVTWLKYAVDDWTVIDGGYIMPRTDNIAVFARNVTLIADSDYGYYKVIIASGQTSNFVQMFHIERKDTKPKTFRSTMQSKSSDNSPFLYIVLTICGAVVGVIFTVFGCHLKTRYRGGAETNSFCSPRSNRDSGKELVYEDIDEHRMRIPANFYSDLDDLDKTSKGQVHGLNQSTSVKSPPLGEKVKFVKADGDPYIDMAASKRIATISHDDYLNPLEYSRMERRKSFDSGELLNDVSANYMPMQGLMNNDINDNKQVTYANEGKI